MKGRGLVRAVALTVLLVGPAWGQTQSETNERAGSELRKAEARMDALYARVMARTSDAAKEALQAAQETWLRFRDQECEFETMGTVGKPINPMVVAECRRRLTDQRAKDLDDLANCQDGSPSCVRR